MADQGPDISQEMTGLAQDGPDPSMEDILASIRKIIAEDDAVIAEPDTALMSDPLSLDATDKTTTPSDASNDFDELILDDILILDEEAFSTDDLAIPDAKSVEDVETPTDNYASVTYNGGEVDVSLNGTPPPASVENEIKIVMADEIEASRSINEDQADSLGDNDVMDFVEEQVSDKNNDMPENGAPSDADLMADILNTEDMNFASASIDGDGTDTVAREDLISLDLDDQPSGIYDISGKDDMALVKSLMADLTADIGQGDPELDDTLSADTENEDQLLDDILDISLEDQVAEEQSSTDEAKSLINETDGGSIDKVETSLNTLLQIAQSAERDATDLQNKAIQIADQPEPETDDIDVSSQDEDVVNDAIDTDVIQAESVEQDIETNLIETEHEADIGDDTLDTAPTILEDHEETAEMPKTATKSTILDEVTETATADAFAQLNQAVELKAAVDQQGPAVGDLVQEALRPMLKEWLDKNLKGIVERTVKAEIKRISSGK